MISFYCNFFLTLSKAEFEMEMHAYIKPTASVKTVIISYLQAWSSSATLLQVDCFTAAYLLLFIIV